MEDVLMNRIALGTMLAERMKENDFTDHDRLVWLIKQINREMRGGRRVYLIHRGDGLQETERSVDNGLTTFWLGDKISKYVFMRVHDGASLDGMVSVKMHTTLDHGQAQVVINVWPVSETDGPLVGTLWMTEGFGHYGGRGNAPVFATERISVFLPFARFVGTLNGFCFGEVLFDGFGFDSQVILSNMMEMVAAKLGQNDPENALPLFVTPLGVARGRVKSEYFIHGKLPAAKPDGLSAGYFEVLRAIFHDGIKIVGCEAVKEILTRIGVVEEVQLRFIRRMNKMSDEGWFQMETYGNDTYYIPTPKLLVVLK